MEGAERRQERQEEKVANEGEKKMGGQVKTMRMEGEEGG